MERRLSIAPQICCPLSNLCQNWIGSGKRFKLLKGKYNVQDKNNKMMSNKEFKKAEQHYYNGLAENQRGNWGLAEEEFLKALVRYQKIQVQNELIVLINQCNVIYICLY